MIKTKAAFRALRESIGLTQQNLADELGVTKRSVARWEDDAAENQPPDDVWEWLVDHHQAMMAESRDAAAKTIALAEEERWDGPIAIRYYRTQEALDAAQAPAGLARPVGYVNTVSMRAAEIIEESGFETSLVYDDSMTLEPIDEYSIEPLA